MPPTFPRRPASAARRPAHPVSRAASAAAAALLALTPSLSRAGDVWDGGSAVDSNWTTAANWTPDGAPANDGTRHLVFSGGNRLFPNVNTPYSVGSLTFFSTTGSFTIGGTTLTLGAGGIANNDTEAQTISAPLAIGADQTWSAASGSLSVGSVSLGANDLTTGGAQLVAIGGAVTSASSAATLTVAGGTTRLGGASANTMSGTWFVNAGTLELDKTGTDNAIRSPLVIGDGVGTDVVRLLRTNQIASTAATTVTLNTGGVLHLNGFNETISTLSFNGSATVSTDAGVLTVDGDISTTSTAQAALIDGNLTISGARTFTVANGGAGFDLNIQGVLAGTGATLTKAGPGTMMLSGPLANTHTGTFVVAEGTLQLVKPSNNNAIAAGLTVGGGPGAATVAFSNSHQIHDAAAVTVSTNGTITLNVQETLNNLSFAGGNFGGTGTLTLGGDVAVTAATTTSTLSVDTVLIGNRTFNVADGTPANDLNVTAELTGVGAQLVKAGPGTMTLGGSAANAYTGTTTVNEGTLILSKTAGVNAIPGQVTVGAGATPATLRLGQSNQIPDAARLIVRANGTADLNFRSDDIDMLDIRDGAVTLSPGGTLGIASIMQVPGGGTATATISGGTVVGRGATLTITGSAGTAETDLVISSVLAGNTIKKLGSANVRLSGFSSNTFAALDFDAGRIHLAKELFSDAIPAVPVSVGGAGSTASLVWERDEQIADGAQITLLSSSVLSLNGHTETLANLTLTDGSIGGGTLVIPTAGVFTQSGGGNDATVINYGTHNYNGGNPTAALVNEGTMNINAEFFGDFVNRSVVNVAPGHTAWLDDASANHGTIHLNSATLRTVSAFTNTGTITGRGTLSSVSPAAFTNLGAILPTGPMTVDAANGSTFTNAGDITLPAGIPLLVTGSGLSNSGTITLAGGALSASSTVTNAPGGVIAGRGSVSNTTGSFANAGGVIRPVDGTLSFNQSFTSTGLVDLRNGTVAGPGTLTNQGRITGNGTISKPLANAAAGRIEPAGHLTVGTNLANAGTIALPAGATLYLPLGSSNAGTISLAGGTYDNNNLPLSNTGQITGFGTLATGGAGLTNNGAVTLTGGLSVINGNVTNLAGKTFKVQHNPAIFTGQVTNNGTFQVINTTATFAGGFAGTGPSAPSALAVDPTGALLASFVEQASVTNSGDITVRPKSDGGADSTVSNLTLLPGSTFDLADNDLTVTTTPAATIRQYLSDGRLTSTAPDPTDLLALGYSPAAPILITLTYLGDANLDGLLNPDDYALLDRGFATGGSFWWQGDFNYDAKVDHLDYLLLDRTHTLQSGSYLPTPSLLAQRESQFGPAYVSQLLTSIPEPFSILPTCGLAALLICRRQSRYRRL